jgi:ubiquinone/menaquinone biosynthesis C-methylase UbiE
MNRDQVSARVERFSGFADQYDQYRPKPPSIIVDILTQLAGTDEPALVVDIGSGTGLSTRIWAGRAVEVVGIEPNADMRRQAQDATDSPGIRFQEGLATDTGLPNESVDIVTVSQAFHWMEPEPTLAEVARILRPGGVFAVYDCDWPPTFNPEAEQAYREFSTIARKLREEHGEGREASQFKKDQHLDRIRDSGRFSWIKEVCVHSVDAGDADRLVGLALSFGGIADLFKWGLSEKEIGVETLRDAAERALGDSTVPWYFTYRIRLGIK